MSSTYSPDLRLELIGTGDQAGVWGATTNTNLEYIIEPAVAGYISVAVVSADQALTYINGGSAVPGDNQAVHAVIALTTSTGANFAVYIPPASKLYTFYNASSYTATVYCSTSIGDTNPKGTGIAIPAGKTMPVWSDGTNVAQQTDHLISPTMASPAMSGTPTAPTAAAGTNTTQLATTAFVQGEKASPAFTGTPTAPTAAYGTNTTQLATTAFVQAALALLYPVGSIYTSTVSTNPGTLFGFGTWVAFGAGRVLIGDGGGFSAGSTGGSADAIVVSHTHSVTDPGHQHTVNSLSVSSTYYQSAGGAGQFFAADKATSTAATGISVGSTGSSGTNANLQPYVVVYMWNRTA